MKVKISFEKASTLLVIIASLGSLFIIFRQTELMSKQFELQRLEQHKSVLPYLTMFNTSNNKTYGYSISNKGIGPALINAINITYKDSVYKNHDLRDFFKVVITKNDTLFKDHKDIGHSTLREGMLIPANESITNVYYDNQDRDRTRSLRRWFNEEIIIEVIFSSIYGEKWQLKSNYSTPQKIKGILD
jgi:hypothetical protein